MLGYAQQSTLSKSIGPPQSHSSTRNQSQQRTKWRLVDWCTLGSQLEGFWLSVSLLRNYCHHFCRGFNRIARSSSSLINAHFVIRRTMRQISIRNSFGGTDLHRCRKYRRSPRFLYVVETRARSIVESAVALGRSTPFVDVFVGPPPWKQLVPLVPFNGKKSTEYHLSPGPARSSRGGGCLVVPSAISFRRLRCRDVVGGRDDTRRGVLFCQDRVSGKAGNK